MKARQLPRFAIVWTIFRKELLEIVRDKRTMFLLIAFPLLFYPLLLIVVAEVTTSQVVEMESGTIKVAIEGELPPKVREAIVDAKATEIVVDASPLEGLRTRRIDAIVTGSDGLSGTLRSGGTGKITISYDSVRPQSSEAYSRMEAALKKASDNLVNQRLGDLNRARAFIEPIDVAEDDIAPKTRRYGSIAALILPMLILVFMVTGAFYPAVDLTAGEQERKTMQTLLTSPIRPLEIVTGKYLTVFSMAVISGVTNVVSIVLAAGYNVWMAGNSGTTDLGIDIAWQDVVGLLWSVILLGLMLSALMMTIATFAKSSKNAQSYISPVYMLCLLPVLIAQIPGIEISSSTVFVPILNLSLVMKQILIHGVSFEHLFLVTVSSVVVTTVILLVAARLFSRQELLISAGGLSTVSGLAAGEEGEKRPSIDEALALVSIALFMLFYAGSAMQSFDLLAGLVLTLVGLILVPTIAFARIRRYDFATTFHLRRPRALTMLGSLLLGASVFVWVSMLTQLFHQTFLPMPEPFMKAMEEMFQLPEGPLGIVLGLAVFALTPAICEEALFRGFLLSSFRGRTKGWIAVVATGLIFGVFHLSMYRLLGTASLGILMGWLVWYSGSIWPSVLFHFTNNALAIIMNTIKPPFELTDPMVLGVAVVLTCAGFAAVWFGGSPDIADADKPPPEPQAT